MRDATLTNAAASGTAASNALGAPLLAVESLASGYGHVAVLEDVSLAVAPATIVAVVGSNGAGKSTLLKTISGLLVPTAGRIVFDGRALAGLAPRQVVAAGLVHVAEGRRLFRRQSVADNLELGLWGEGLSRAAERERFDEVYAMFPILAEKRALPAGSLSGGQQQMLAIGCALMRRPRLLMLDEPSLGLAPVIVDQVLETLQALRARGCAVLLVEQLVERALEIADHCCVMRNGRVIGAGTPRQIEGSGLLEQAYGQASASPA